MVAENFENITAQDAIDACHKNLNRVMTLSQEAIQLGDYERARELLREGYETLFLRYEISAGMRNLFLEKLKSEPQEDKKRYLIKMAEVASTEMGYLARQLEKFGGIEEGLIRIIQGDEQ